MLHFMPHHLAPPLAIIHVEGKKHKHKAFLKVNNKNNKNKSPTQPTKQPLDPSLQERGKCINTHTPIHTYIHADIHGIWLCAASCVSRSVIAHISSWVFKANCSQTKEKSNEWIFQKCEIGKAKNSESKMLQSATIGNSWKARCKMVAFCHKLGADANGNRMEAA